MNCSGIPGYKITLAGSGHTLSVIMSEDTFYVTLEDDVTTCDHSPLGGKVTS